MPFPDSVLTRYAFVDIETTGLEPLTDEIIEVGAAFVEAGVVVRREAWQAKPSGELPPLITALTGLSDAELADAPAFDQIAPAIRAALEGWTLVAHNGAFERSFLGELVADLPMIDSCELMHLLFPELPRHSLEELVRWSGCATGTRHRALGDAEDTLAVVRHALRETLREGRRVQVLALAEAIGGASEAPPAGEASRRTDGRQPGSAGDPGSEASDARSACAPSDPDRLELVALLQRLAAGMADRPSAAPTPRRPADPDLELARQLEDGPVIEAEHPALLEALARSARDHTARTGTSVAIALPWRRLRDAAQATGREVLVPPARVVCAARWRRIEGQLPRTTDTARAAAAYLGAWLDRVAVADVGLLSGWMLGRAPELGLFAAAARCNGQDCDGETCGVRRSERIAEAPVFLVPHELGLDWLERNVPGLRVLFADAQLLVEAARRRTSFVLDSHHALAFADAVDQVCATGTGPFRACAEALEATLSQEQEALTRVQATGGHVSPRLRVRDDVSALGHELALLLAALREVPGPIAEAVRREGRELAALIGRFITTPPPGMEQIVPAGWRVPGLLLRTVPEVLATALGVQLRRAAGTTGVALVSPLHSPAPHAWLAPLGVAGAPVIQLGGPGPRRPMVHVLREPTPALAARLADLARLAGQAGVAVVVEDLTEAAAALLPALRAGRVSMRVAGGVDRGGVQLTAWRAASATAARVVVVTGAPRASEVRALLLQANGVEHLVLALDEPADAERWAAPLAGFEPRASRWAEVLAALGATAAPASPPSASPASLDRPSALHQRP